MTKEELVNEIRGAFKAVKLHEGIGLWEAQAIDNYADEKEKQLMREKDERYNWDRLSYKDLSYCHSSLSFFDGKGMRFHLPKYMIFDLEADEIYDEYEASPPDLIFHLSYKLHEEHQKKQFSALTERQKKCVLSFLQFKLEDIFSYTEPYPLPEPYSDNFDGYLYHQLYHAIQSWKGMINDTPPAS